MGLNRNGIAILLLAALVLFVATLCSGCGKKEGGEREHETVSHVKISNRSSVSEGPPVPVVLDLGRGKCVPCKKMIPIMEELAREYEGRAIIEMIDIEEPGGEEVADRYDVRMIPTQIFMDAGGNEVWRHEGFLSRADIEAKLDEMGVTDP